MNIPGEVILVFFGVVALVLIAIGLTVVRKFIWPQIKGPAKAILTLVLIGALIAVAVFAIGWIGDPFNQIRVQNIWTSTSAFGKAWWIANIGDLPDPQAWFQGVGKTEERPAAPQISVDLAGLSEPLPQIPVQVNVYRVKNLPKFVSSTQKFVNQKDLVVAVGGVISPTLSTIKTTTTTIGFSNIVTDSMPARVPLTDTVTALVYRDGSIVISTRPFSETVQLWLQGVQRVAAPIVELDEQPEETRRIAKTDRVRQQVRDEMTAIETLLDFQPELVTGMGVASVDKIPNFVKTQNLTNRVRLAVFQAQFCGIAQAPRDRNEGGTPALRGLVDCVRTKYHALDARAAELIWTRDPAKAKQETPGFQELHAEILKALTETSDLIDKLDAEVEAQGLDSGNLADYEQVYDLKLVDLLVDAESKLTDLKVTVEAP